MKNTKEKNVEKSWNFKSLSIFLLRVSFGWLFLYAGLTKILDPEWTAVGFLTHSQTFSSFYEWFASAANIGWVDFMNQWGQLFIGLALIFGAFTRLASFFAILLMLLYYFPSLDFPYVEHGYLIDDHILYSLALLLLISFRAGQYCGVDKFLMKKFKGWWM